MVRDVGSISAIESKYSDYEEAFEKIKEATNITNINELVARFEEAETNNFSLLKYVESLSIEIRELEDGIAEVQSEIDSLKQTEGEDDDPEQNTIISSLKKELD